MSRTYKRITADLDPERGNAVTIRREDVAPLVKSLPTEVTAPIIDAFIRWFCNVAEPEIKDALARAMLEQFKERQREAVKRYVAVCDSRRPDKASEPDGETQVETSTHKPLNKENKKNEVNEDTSVLFGDASVTPSGGDSTPTASPPTAVVGSAIGKQDVIDARATVARYAPEPKFVLAFDPLDSPDNLYCDCERCDTKQQQKCKVAGEKGHAADPQCENLSCREMFVDARALSASDNLRYCGIYETRSGFDERSFWCDYSKYKYQSDWSDSRNEGIYYGDQFYQQIIGEKPTPRLVAAVDKFIDTLGDEIFTRAVWTFYIQKNAGQLPDKDKDGNATNYGKLLFGRLKRLVEAKAVLAQVDDTRQRSTPPPPPPRSAQ